MVKSFCNYIYNKFFHFHFPNMTQRIHRLSSLNLFIHLLFPSLGFSLIDFSLACCCANVSRSPYFPGFEPPPMLTLPILMPRELACRGLEKLGNRRLRPSAPELAAAELDLDRSHLPRLSNDIELFVLKGFKYEFATSSACILCCNVQIKL